VTEAETGLAAIETELQGYPPYVATTQMCEAIFSVIPGMPKLAAYGTLEACAAAVQPETLPAVLQRARDLGDDPGLKQALFAARSIDTGDTGITIVTGVRSALSLFLGSKGPGAGANQQQKTDAALKAVALAFIVSRVIGGPPEARVHVLKSMPAGQELLAYFAAIEIALPFADDVAAAGGAFVSNLVETRSRSVAGKLLGVIGQDGLSDAEETLRDLTAALDELALFIQPRAHQLAASVKTVMPAVLGGGDSLVDLVAAGADALPAYRYLVARVAMESRIALAKIELMPNIEMEAVTPLPPVSVPPPPPVPPELGVPSNPFADPDNGARAVEAVDAPEPFVLPTAPLPADRRLNGVYSARSGEEDTWFLFTVAGVFARSLPPTHPADWASLHAAGHPVGRYEREGSTVEVQWPDGSRSQFDVISETYALVIDGQRFVRCDYALAGSFLLGSYVRRGHDETLVLAADGTSSRGTYSLGMASIHFEGGRAESLYSTLKPSSGSPQTIYIGGVTWDLVSS
jgi:hypothetical protein